MLLVNVIVERIEDVSAVTGCRVLEQRDVDQRRRGAVAGLDAAAIDTGAIARDRAVLDRGAG